MRGVMKSYLGSVKAATLESYQERIGRAVRHLESHLEEPIPLEELASVAHFSPYHFHRIFRGIVGESVKEHIRRLRLERAAQRLGRGEGSVLGIALDAGYETHESFTRAFEAMFGVSPTAFRKNGGIMNPVAREEKKAGPPLEVNVRRMEPLRVAYVRHTGPYSAVGQAWQKLMMWAGMNGLMGPNVRILGISHDDPEITPPERLRYDAAIVVPEHVKGSGEVGIAEIPAGDYATVVHRGPYDSLGITYARMCGEWLPASGRELRDAPPIEFYLNDMAVTAPPDLRTEICLPLR
jgi:AraC family transcriptional regulator